jgi:sortase B
LQAYTSTTNVPVQATDSETSAPRSEDSQEAELQYIVADFYFLKYINPDAVGWIAIPGTPISYPVVQAADNVKYLNRSFDGSHSKAGTPFADKDNNMENLDTNTIIYGHNMGTGRTDMFSTLLRYKDQEFYSAHKYIQFDTVYELHGYWEVFAVIELDIRNTGFQYQQMRFHSESEFMDWIDDAKALSFHETDRIITPDNHILTLSTCDRGRYGRSGRLLILAVRVLETIE